MTLLESLGLASFVFVAAFTYRAYTAQPTPGQTPRQSIIEAWMNILVGFTINYAMNLVLIPLAVKGGTLSHWDNFWMGWIYTTVSILRQYALRRWWNDALHRAAQKLATLNG
jgi:hypothetical protein